MSALGHYIEEEGIATVAIALIRPQAERTRPPRALWVPFELGRPFGPPSDPAFQKRVIGAALRLLAPGSAAGPIVLADFPDDDPREGPDPAWRPPIARGEALPAEVAALQAPYERSCAARGRTTVGLSGLTPSAAAGYVAAWLGGARPESPIPELSPLLCLRFAIDDLKAYALEAALAGGGRPPSKQLGDWLWNDSAMGAAFRELRLQLLDGEDERAKAVAAFFVPALRLAVG